MLRAVRVADTVPLEPSGAVPETMAVPLPLSLIVNHLGRVPLALSPGVGEPVEVTVKLTLPPRATSISLGEVMTGRAATVRTKDWVRVTPLRTKVMVIG